MEKEWFAELVESCDPELTLAIVCWTISKIDQHGNDPGSFRHLIYSLMGFGPEAYVPVYEAGGMNITNELDYSSQDYGRNIIREEKIENKKLKQYFSICDEPGCFEGACCGWPSEPEYRRTCYEHSNFGKNENAN